MSDIHNWSLSANGNVGSSPDYLSEGCAPSAVNDAFREMQAAIARKHRVQNPFRTATATVNTNVSYCLEHPDISLGGLHQGQVVGFVAPQANTGTANLQILGVANTKYPIKWSGHHLDTSAIDTNQVVIAAYNAAGGPSWDMLSHPVGVSRIGISAVTTLSGATTDITGIPPWVRRIIIGVAGMSTNGTSNIILQLGDSGGIENSSYVSGASTEGATVNTDAISTAGVILTGTQNAAYVWSGLITLVLTDPANNTWVCSGIMHRSDSSTGLGTAGSGYKSLSAVLDRVRLTTAGGANTFDAGTMTLQYE